MMGYSHTVSAAAGWLVLVETGVVQVPDTPTLIVTTLACAGAGMLPDIDHHNGSIANSIPPISRLGSTHWSGQSAAGTARERTPFWVW